MPPAPEKFSRPIPDDTLIERAKDGQSYHVVDQRTVAATASNAAKTTRTIGERSCESVC